MIGGSHLNKIESSGQKMRAVVLRIEGLLYTNDLSSLMLPEVALCHLKPPKVALSRLKSP